MSLHDRAWRALTTETPPALDIRGAGHPILPARTACSDAVTAAMAVALQAVSIVDSRRGRHAPLPVELDLRHVAAAAVSERIGHLVGRPVPAGFAPLSRFWPTSDGWIRIHANYPWHRDRALAVLGCEEAGFGDAVRAWRAEELEAALTDAGALGVVVRTPEEWGAHPQAQAIRHLPVASWERGGQQRRLPPGRFLQDVRVLDLTRVIAGPTATRVLAGWGAQVLRVDPPYLPEIDGQTIDALSGKRSACLDFRDRGGRRVLDELLGGADLLVHAYRPGALARFGLNTAALAERYPGLSVVSITAWGAPGPWAGHRGFDSLVQAATGLAAIEGTDEEPGTLPAQVLDHATGHLAAAAAALSLVDGPRHTTLSLAQTAQWLLSGGTSSRRQHEPAAIDPGPFLVQLRGAGRTVRVVAPPGRIGSAAPRWSATTAMGADEPTFS